MICSSAKRELSAVYMIGLWSFFCLDYEADTIENPRFAVFGVDDVGSKLDGYQLNGVAWKEEL